MVEVSSIAPKAEEKHRSWLALALGASLAAHAGLAAMLWVERPPQPEAGAVFDVEIVHAAGAAGASSARNGAPARGAADVTKPEAAPAPRTPMPPDAPRAAHAAPVLSAAARPAAETAKPSPPDTARPPVDEVALRRPAPAARAGAPSPAMRAPAPPVPPRKLAERRATETALRRPARIPPPPAKTPHLAAAAPHGSAQTASVPIVAADAAPGAAAPSAGPESGTTPPRYGFGSAANPIPRYPTLARENGWEGVVMLTVSVGAGGEALGVSIAKSSGHGLLDASAVDAVRRWRFEPARRAGMPVAGTALVPIRFRLEE